MWSGRSTTFLVVLALVLAACSSSGEPATSSTVTSTTVAATTTTVPIVAVSTTVTTTTVARTTTSRPHATALTVAVQLELAALGYFDDAVDGIYGPVTEQAVRRFQKAAGITVDGRYGPETASALAKALEKDKAFVEKIQKDLAKLGLYSGPIDGDYGAGTTAAVKTLQKRCDLAPTVDGHFTPITHVCLDQALHK